MKYVKKIEGEKVFLSPVCVEDLDTYVTWLNDFKVTDGTGKSGQVMTFTMEKEWLENAQKEGSYFFSIVSKETEQLIGNAGLERINYINRTANFGIFIGEEKERGKGYGTEVTRLLIEYGFSYLNLKNILLTVYSFNEKAIKAYEKAGFKEFGRRRQAVYVNGTYYDIIYMDILKEEAKTGYIKNKNR